MVNWHALGGHLRRVIAPYIGLKPSAWAFFSSVALSLAFVLGIGPELQKHSFSVFGSDAPDIYSAAYANDIAIFLPISVWLQAAFHPVIIFMSIIIVIISARADRFDKFIISIGVFTAILWTVLDLIGNIWTRKFSFSLFAIDFSANMFGGIMTFVLFLCILSTDRWIIRSLLKNRVIHLYFSFTFILLCGVLSSSAVYFICREVYHVMPVQASVVIGRPASGFYYADSALLPSKRPPKSDGSGYFHLLPTSSSTLDASVQGIKGNISIEWSAGEGEAAYEAEIQLLGDCFRSRVEGLPTGASLFQKRDIKRVLVKLDGGVSVVQVASGSRRVASISDKGPYMFWISKDTKNETISTTNYSSDTSQIRISSATEVTLLANAMLLRSEQGRLLSTPRVVAIELDGSEWQRTFESEESPFDQEKLNCRTLDTVPDSSQGQDRDNLRAMSIGALVKIKPVRERGLISGMPENSLTITRQEGSTSVGMSAPSSDVWPTGEGTLTFFGASGALSDLVVGRDNAEIKAHERLVMIGDFRARFLRDGQINISGLAKALWKDSSRLNSTRWEKWPTEWQVAIISTLLIAAGLVVRWAYSRFLDYRHEGVAL